MEKVNIGIITPIRKLRFAYRTIFSEHIQSPARIVFEGPSIESISSNSCLRKAELLLLDYRLVYKNTALFFSLTNSYFTSSPIFLLVNQNEFSEAQRCKAYVHLFVTPDSDIMELFSQIRNFPKSVLLHSR